MTVVSRCAACGYDLTGLTPDRPCPECGAFAQVAVAPPKRFGREAAMGSAPTGYLRRLSAGFLACAIGAIGRGIVPCAGEYGLLDALPGAYLIMIVGGLAAAWAVGGWLITAPRPAGTVSRPGWDGKTEWRELRWMVRGSSVLGIVASITLIAYLRGAPYWLMAPWAISEGFFTAVCCWYAARIADWAQDDGVAGRLRAMAWMIGSGVVGFGLIIAQPWVGAFPLIWLLVIVVAMAVIGSIIASITMVQGASDVAWVMRNMRELAEREGRLRARAAQSQVRGAHERDAAPPASPERDRLMEEIESRHRAMEDAAPAIPDGPRPGRSQVIERGAGDTYGLEGEGEARGIRHG